jgi:hypothetical protein
MLVCVVSLTVLAGCSSKRTFTVYSWPEGAKVFLDGEEKGQTEERVTIDFSERPYGRIRVEMRGYQPAGMLVTPSSPEAISFVLAVAPDRGTLSKIDETLRNIERKLDK